MQKIYRFVGLSLILILITVFSCQMSVTDSSTDKKSSSTSSSSSISTSSSSSSTNYVYFVKQANGTTTATPVDAPANNSIAVSATYGTSGNAFKYVSGVGYYGTNSNGFISYHTPMSGDFTISATITITAQNKANNACGIGVGMTTGFNATDRYAYALMRNSSNFFASCYVNSATNVNMTNSSLSFTNNTSYDITFRRTGTSIYWSAVQSGGTTPTEVTFATSNCTDGTTVYGDSAVYPCISFNNVNATITNLVIRDASNNVVFNSTTGDVITFIPASLTLSSTTASVEVGLSTTVTAVAKAIGGSIASVTAVADDPTVVDVSVTNGSSDSTITLTGLKGGVANVTVTNTADSNSVTRTKTIVVSVNAYSNTDDYGTIPASSLYPQAGSTGAYTDGELAITFDSAPTLNSGGSIKIYRYSDGVEVDSIAFTGETQTTWSTTINVGTQLVRISGNTLYFTPHFGKLEYNTKYYIAIPTTAITGTFNGYTFVGFSNKKTVATWNFTTRSAPSLTASNVTVDGSQTSTADFRTIQGALSYLDTAFGPGTTSPVNVTINVAAGTYNEFVYYKGGHNITIAGPAGNNKGDTCIVQYINGNMMNGSTHTRAMFYISNSNLVLKNITLKNNGVRSVVGQAETIYFANGTGKTMAAYNCTFSSRQDTIQTSGRNWFYRCHIEGNVDFIWGTADVALFEDCTLRVINDVNNGSMQSYSIIVARTGVTNVSPVGKGYVLMNSTVAVDNGVTVYFGRNAGGSGFYDQAALINVTFSASGYGSDTGLTPVIGTGLWNTATAPLGISPYDTIGWKSSGCSGLNYSSLTTAANTSSSIASQATEYDTRDHILNRYITISGGAVTGFADASTIWDISALVSDFGAP